MSSLCKRLSPNTSLTLQLSRRGENPVKVVRTRTTLDGRGSQNVGARYRNTRSTHSIHVVNMKLQGLVEVRLCALLHALLVVERVLGDRLGLLVDAEDSRVLVGVLGV